ncbi:MAG: hypothetical protein EZS28_040072 [Streblomastix strix]|uniref:Uncharacterized protein n=1 Tax=Streblomastix strix TaxID=222440 RepID=A0A5J4U317_9EUKA|nr:MAG: hypothetical protein EZS28_040072 [Streblomastix strix]
MLIRFATSINTMRLSKHESSNFSYLYYYAPSSSSIVAPSLLTLQLWPLTASITAFSLHQRVSNDGATMDDDDGAQQYKYEKFELSCFESRIVFMLV